MQEEQDTCRICSGPAEPDQPLFYPCKCSGTIRYIHQDCLTTWLAHSKKKTCDVCKHPYSFTKVYSPAMPARLPVLLLLKQLFRQAILLLMFGTRALLVACIWLAFLPWATIWTWRMYFAMGNSTAWWISNRPRPHSGLDIFPLFVANETTVASNGTTQNNPANATSTSFLSHPTIRALSSDIVSGQIIASLIVLAFVAIFLLREWISQNARPGVFEDADLDGVGDDVPPPVPPNLQAGMQPLPQIGMAPEVLQPPPFRARGDLAAIPPAMMNHRPWLRDMDIDLPPRPATPHPEVQVDEARNARRLQGANDVREWRMAQQDSGKGKSTGVDPDRRFEDENQEPKRRRRRPMSSGSSSSAPQDSDSDNESSTPRHSRAKHRRSIYQRTRVPRDKKNHKEPLALEPLQQQFTFTANPPPQRLDHDLPKPSTPLTEDAHINGAFSFGFLPNHQETSASMTSGTQEELTPSIESDEKQPLQSPATSPSSTLTERGDSPSSFSSFPTTTSLVTSSSRVHGSASFSESSIAGGSRRPPLPSATLPSSAGQSRSRAATPLASPSLAIYRAPEELEAGPSKPSGYFSDSAELASDDMEAEHRIYFREPSDSDGYAGNGRVGDESGELTDEIEVEFPRWTDDEDEHVEDGDHAHFERPREREVPEVNVVFPEQGADAQAARARPPDANDEVDANIDDDMDGALEAIGLRGPLHNVLQNAGLMIFILDATIAVGIWLPFTIGKTVALLSLEPRRMMQILHLPLRLIRFVTDPIVDSVIYLFSRLVLPPMTRSILWTWDFIIRRIGTVIGHQRTDEGVKSMNILQEQLGKGYAAASELVHRLLNTTADVQPSTEAQTSRFSLFVDRVLEHESAARLSEEVFAPLGKRVRELSEVFQAAWLRLAIGNGPNEKVFAVVLGYAVVGLGLALYLNVLTVGSVRTAGRAVRNAVRQQLLVVKVASFIVIELVVFPLGCGIMLDLCTVWLFPQGSFRARAAFVLFAPITSIFYHWVVGTMFMYQFAVLLAGCRGIMRPGAMWFIKDPQDQNFHPIRDILERPTLVQIRKLLLSAVMYSLVVVTGVATISGILRIFSRTIMPLRWKIQEPLSDVPIDLLFLHVVLPYTMHYFRPKKALRLFGNHLWKYLAKHLRLTSYMFGGRHPSEEFTPKHWSWRRLLMKIDSLDVEMDDAEAVHDGTYRRVPNSDNIALVKDSPATAAVDADGRPLDDRQAELIAVQNAEAEKAKRSIKDDYTIVYMPPQFKYRIGAFILCLWLVGSIMLATSLAAPILIGRAFFRLIIPYDVHDGYSFIVGFYLLWACWIIGFAIDRLDKRRQRRGPETRQAEWPLYLTKRALLWIAKASYMVFCLGFVIPTLVALVMELYVVLPVRHMANPTLQPRIRIVEMWSLGLLYVKILLRAQRLRPNHRIMRGVERITRNGWTRPDPFSATLDVIAPLTFGLLGMILLPAAVLWSLRRLLDLPIGDDFLFLHMYPGIFTVAGLGHAAFSLSKLVSTWSQSIRDKEFLVEMRLRNLESEPEVEQPEAEVKSEVAVEEEEEAEEEAEEPF